MWFINQNSVSLEIEDRISLPLAISHKCIQLNPEIKLMSKAINFISLRKY